MVLAATQEEDYTDFAMKMIKQTRDDLSNRSAEWIEPIVQAWLDRVQPGAFEATVAITQLGARNLPAQPPSLINQNNWLEVRERLNQ